MICICFVVPSFNISIGFLFTVDPSSVVMSSISLEREFVSALEDPNSEEYQTLAMEFETEVGIWRTKFVATLIISYKCLISEQIDIV